MTPSGIEDVFRAQRDVLAVAGDDWVVEPAALGRVAGADTRTVVGPPLA